MQESEFTDPRLGRTVLRLTDTGATSQRIYGVTVMTDFTGAARDRKDTSASDPGRSRRIWPSRLS